MKTWSKLQSYPKNQFNRRVLVISNVSILIFALISILSNFQITSAILLSISFIFTIVLSKITRYYSAMFGLFIDEREEQVYNYAHKLSYWFLALPLLPIFSRFGYIAGGKIIDPNEKMIIDLTKVSYPE
jgi:hypothetical protein